MQHNKISRLGCLKLLMCLDIKGSNLLVWLEMLMSLYQEQFGKNISPLLAKEAEDVRNNILHHLYTTNVNSI